MMNLIKTIKGIGMSLYQLMQFWKLRMIKLD